MDTIRGWTRQVPEVADELARTGVYRVKEEYIRKKNDNIADFYLKLYEWYTKKSRNYVQIPEDVRYPVWLSLTEEFRLQPVPGTVILTVEMPRDKVLIIDSEKWDYRGNNMYVPTDDAERKRFERELHRYGIADETALVEEKGNFYPMLKREVLSSWERIFTMPPADPGKGFATVWELKREWVTEVITNE